jgi:hypothetical protein
MRLWQSISRTVLWDYERGSVPFDLMVGAIVLFVLLAPRAWFNDRPRIAPGDLAGSVEVLRDDRAAGIRVYRIGAHLLAPTNPDAQWERRAHSFLGKNVESLRGRNFRIEKVEMYRAEDGTVYYDVAVKQ